MLRVPAIRRQFFIPPEPLRGWVERVWSWESDGPVPLPLLLPGTGNDLMFHYRTPFQVIEPNGQRIRLPAAHLTGLRSGARRLAATGPLGFVAVRFRTSMLRHFGPIPLEALLDRFPSVTEQFGPEAAELPDRLAALPNFSARALFLTRWLFARLPAPSTAEVRADRTASAIYYGATELSIAQFADEMGYSCRQLERTVHTTTGLSPKRFQRLARFHHTARALLLRGQPDYLDTALANGYYDQAHVIHEFQSLGGVTPGELLTPESCVSHFYNPPLTG